MVNRKRQGNDTKRRIAPPGQVSAEVIARLSAARYVGSAMHKSKPADYGFNPPVSPRLSKSLCDDLRVIRKSEAAGLFQAGIERGMVSTYQIGGLPKYVWAVDSYGQAYESKLSSGTSDYHGYRLSEFRDRDMRLQVINEWGSRSQVWRSN